MSDHTEPDEQTKAAERAESEIHAHPDRQPRPDEERDAETHKVDPSVREHAEEMAERGAHQQGEGRVP